MFHVKHARKRLYVPIIVLTVPETPGLPSWHINYSVVLWMYKVRPSSKYPVQSIT